MMVVSLLIELKHFWLILKRLNDRRETGSWSYKQNLSINLLYGKFRALLLVEILEQPIRNCFAQRERESTVLLNLIFYDRFNR